MGDNPCLLSPLQSPSSFYEVISQPFPGMPVDGELLRASLDFLDTDSESEYVHVDIR